MEEAGVAPCIFNVTLAGLKNVNRYVGNIVKSNTRSLYRVSTVGDILSDILSTDSKLNQLSSLDL